MISKNSFFAAIVCSVLCFATAQAQELNIKYRVSVYEQGPGVAELIQGDVDGAIRKAKVAAALPDPLEAYLTLCAAYLATGDLSAAETYCQDSVDIADSQIQSRLYNNTSSKNAAAIAYSNRGVLRAQQNDLALAQRDFASALKAKRNLENAKINQELAASQRLVASK